MRVSPGNIGSNSCPMSAKVRIFILREWLFYILVIRYRYEMSDIKKDSNLLSIPLCHYDGFVLKKNLEQKIKDANKERKEGDPMTVIVSKGNASGKDGNLLIDKKTKIVLSFKLWE